MTSNHNRSHGPQTQAFYRQARLSRDPRFDGVFYVGVTSTGIFCRPVCPARLPAEKNVIYYQRAIEALAAGYRPCLRCRPDSAPQSAAWKGVGSTVGRAEKLLAELPAMPVAHIARRLGVSQRYLCQLTSRYLGLAPKQLQIFHQLLFAKRLLQQSGLSVAEVAIACGFNSSHRLQCLMQQHWQLTPSALRSNKKVSHDPATIQLFLACRAPYNWPQVRDFLAGHALTLVEQVSDTSYALAFNWGQSPGHLIATFNQKKCGFDVALRLTDLTSIQPVMENLARVLDTHADPLLISQALQAAGIAPHQLVEGLRLPGTWSYFEAGCRAVLGQQISVKAATNYANQLVAKTHTENQYGPVFPSPEAVVAMPLDALRLPASRQHTLRALATAFTASEPPTRADLLALKGIGPWTCDYMALRGAGDSDIYLESDLIVRKAAAAQPIQAAQATPWRTYLTLQLWDIAVNQQAER